MNCTKCGKDLVSRIHHGEWDELLQGCPVCDFYEDEEYEEIPCPFCGSGIPLLNSNHPLYVYDADTYRCENCSVEVRKFKSD